MKQLFYLPLLLIAVYASTCAPGSQSESHMAHAHTNALINESSPYLLQHAHNPVNWLPWGTEAFDKAKAENRLVLISIGYSACHWCHVMEKETFEDSTAAAYMNEHFICIKVDREERPDVDQVYMNAVQLMTQRGGWPLNCFTLPDGRPIYGGTYFPTNNWMDILENLVNLQKNEPQKLEEYASRLTAGIQQSELIPKNSDPNALQADTIHKLVQDWKRYWDTREGGPNRAPKFPMPNNMDFLMHYAANYKDTEVLEYVKTSLNKMARGGIYDQIGGGFARYSTDALWKVPHFEKMLYDNAQLIMLYADAYIYMGEDEYKRVIEQTLEFIEREMTAPEGAFYSALDADSEGEEGKFYVWTEDELKNILGKDFDFMKTYYNINAKGKWEHGNYILLRNGSDEEMAEKLDMSVHDMLAKADELNAQLLLVRSTKERPGLDNKTLTSWNALMVQAYARAYRRLGNEDYLKSAERSMQFLLDEQVTKDGGLYHNYKAGQSSINGYLEDYCFMMEACIELYEATFDEKWLQQADQFAAYVKEHFYDNESGMFWFTSDLDDPLIARKQEVTDNVIPASNSSMAKALFQLGTLYDRKEFIDLSDQILRNVWPHMDYGQSYSNWAILALWKLAPYYEVAITGPEWDAKRAELDQYYLPNSILLGGESGKLPLLEGKFLGETTLFVCEHKTCQLPVNDIQDALRQMGQ